MAVINYDTIDGRIRAESTGGTRTGYLPDALGSVTATMNDAGAVVNTYRYKPYGSQLAKTGAGADPKLLWLGQLGYRDQASYLFVRARHFAKTASLWGACDPLWPFEQSYVYALSNPTNWTDMSGLNVRPKTLITPVPFGCNRMYNNYIYAFCNKCYWKPPSKREGCEIECDRMARRYYELCGKGRPMPCRFQPWGSLGGLVAPKCVPEKYNNRNPLPPLAPMAKMSPREYDKLCCETRQALQEDCERELSKVIDEMQYKHDERAAQYELYGPSLNGMNTSGNLLVDLVVAFPDFFLDHGDQAITNLASWYYSGYIIYMCGLPISCPGAQQVRDPVIFPPVGPVLQSDRVRIFQE